VKTVKLTKLIDSGIPILCGVLLSLMISFTLIQIILREFFNFSLNWSDEVSQFCMTWMILFGSIWVTKNNLHLNTGLKIHRKLNERQIHLIDGFLALVIAFVVAVVAYRSAIFALKEMGSESLSLRWLKMGYVIIALPLTTLFVCYYYIKSFFKKFCYVFKKK
jgi:TRAP-type C4-dicarboxylate transport system permease small subunit